MKSIRLIKGNTYSYGDKKYTIGKSIIVEDEAAGYLMTTGCFACEDIEDAEMSENPEITEDDSTELTAGIIENMKKDELEELAEQKGIDLKGCRNNEEKAERIKGALGLVNFNHLEFE